ncbi:MAG: hypothetical protein E6G58_02025 [Actinobacteria bacterium]|nr:MAG: hypothetical protein E6G58_02025 [Actinomycetota bacterium]
MAQVTRASVADIDLLASSWRLHLAAERKSAATITAYSYATTQLASFLREHGMPTNVDAITREHIETFLVHLYGIPVQRSFGCDLLTPGFKAHNDGLAGGAGCTWNHDPTYSFDGLWKPDVPWLTLSQWVTLDQSPWSWDDFASVVTAYLYEWASTSVPGDWPAQGGPYSASDPGAYVDPYAYYDTYANVDPYAYETYSDQYGYDYDFYPYSEGYAYA